MKRQTVIIGITVLLFSFALFSPGLFGQPDKRRAAREEWLNLTPEQKTRLEEFRKAGQEERRAFSEQMRKMQSGLRELMKDPEANEKKIDGIIDEMSKLRASHLKSGIKHRAEMKKIFTPEQLDKLKNFRARMRGMGPMRPGLGMMRRPFMGPGFRRGWNRSWGWRRW